MWACTCSIPDHGVGGMLTSGEKMIYLKNTDHSHNITTYLQHKIDIHIYTQCDIHIYTQCDIHIYTRCCT